MSDDATLDDFAQQDDDSEKNFDFSQSKINLSRLEEHISIIKGTKPDRVRDERHDNSEPYLVVSTLTGEERKFTPDTDGPKATSQDTLMIMDGSKSGRVYRGEHGVIGSTMAAIRPKGANSHYLRYFLESNFERLNSATKGSAVPHTDKDLLRSLEYPVPPLPEQRKIATVLYTVDRAIQKTKEVIEQTERTQKGHIRHLFRKGVSDEATETHEVLGEMPTSWQITELSNITDVVMGSSPKSEYYNESGDGLPFYQGNNDFNRRNPTTNVWCTDPVKQAKKGDILISIRAPVGDLNIATEDCCIGRGLAAFRPQSIDFDYLYYHLYERKNWFNRISSGSTFDSINSSQITNTKIKLPPKSIQEKIGSIFRNNELYILKEEEYLNQLQRLKRGLMQDLLSGTVRTADASIEVPEEVAQHG
jgi:type I restriction enzyme S subunit